MIKTQRAQQQGTAFCQQETEQNHTVLEKTGKEGGEEGCTEVGGCRSSPVETQ